MSLLADLLSKLKYQKNEHGDVPLGLKRIVSDSQKKALLKKKLMTFSFFIAFVVISGFGAVYFMESYIKPVTVNKSVQQNSNEIRPSGQTSDKTDIPITTSPSDTPLKDSNSRHEIALNSSIQIAEQTVQKDVIDARGKISPSSVPTPRSIELHMDKKQEAIQHLNDDRDLLLYSARAYESKKDYYEALLNYKKALVLDPQNYIIMNNISSVLIHMGNFSDALQYLENALSVKRDHVPSLINLGISYIRLDNSAGGESYLLRALSIEPSNKNAMFNIAIFYERQGDNDKAYNYFYKLLEMGEIQGRMGTARIAEKQGNISLAVRVYKEIRSMGGVDSQIIKLVNERLAYLSSE